MSYRVDFSSPASIGASIALACSATITTEFTVVTNPGAGRRIRVLSLYACSSGQTARLRFRDGADNDRIVFPVNNTTGGGRTFENGWDLSANTALLCAGDVDFATTNHAAISAEYVVIPA